MKIVRLWIPVCLAGLVVACGQKGPLVLPDAPKHKKAVPSPRAPATPAPTTPAPTTPGPTTPAPTTPAPATPAPTTPAPTTPATTSSAPASTPTPGTMGNPSDTTSKP
ncbi:MAG TPA: lipoprotein [Steroidobacteraceae bacterium]